MLSQTNWRAYCTILRCTPSIGQDNGFVEIAPRSTLGIHCWEFYSGIVQRIMGSVIDTRVPLDGLSNSLTDPP